MQVPAFVSINIMEVLKASPTIYSILFILSVGAFTLWLNSITSLRVHKLRPKNFINLLSQKILEGHFEEASNICQNANHFSAKVLGAGLSTRTYGLQMILDVMKSEGQRAGSTLWQRLSLLNDIAVIAPMLGLLGTVVGMFYAFYDMNRSIESIGQVFDGLGVAVGTTVAGLIVAIFAMILHSTLRFRLVRLLTHLENEALNVASIIDRSYKNEVPSSPKLEEQPV